MADCSSYPTKSTAETFKLDAETVNEVVTSSDDRTPPASDGLTKKTLAGIENDATNQLADIQQRADDQYSDINNQYVLRNKGDYATDPLLESYYEFTDFNGLIYFPIASPHQVDSTTYPDPSNDPNLRLGQATDDSLVTATGSTTPRRLSDRFGEVIHSADFGALCDGATDDSDAVEAALNYRDNVTVDLGGARISREIRMLKSNVTMTGDLQVAISGQIYTFYRTRYQHGTVRIEQNWVAPSIFKMSGRHLRNNSGIGEVEGGRRFYHNFLFNDLIITSKTDWITSQSWEFPGGLFEWTLGTDFSASDLNTVGMFFNSIRNVSTTCFADFFLQVVFEARAYGAGQKNSVFFNDNLIEGCTSNHIKNGIKIIADDPDEVGISDSGGYIKVKDYSLQAFTGTERFIHNDLALDIEITDGANWDWQLPIGEFNQDPIYCSNKSAVVTMDKHQDYNNGLKSCPNLRIMYPQNDPHPSTYWVTRLESQGWVPGEVATTSQMVGAFCQGTILSTNDSLVTTPWRKITLTDLIEFKGGDRVVLYNSGGNVQNFSYLYECPIHVYSESYDMDKQFNPVNMICQTHNIMPFSFIARSYNSSPKYYKVMEVDGVDYFSLSFNVPDSAGNITQSVDRYMTIKVTPGTSVEQKVTVIANGVLDEPIKFPFYWKTTGGITEIFMRFAEIEDTGQNEYKIMSSTRTYKQVEFMIEDAGDSVDPSWTAAIDY
ncbi:endosialidase [Vibrio phage 1.074.O._10N.222.49.B7]|nr:endosialidase [Vibrio phage 1.074.O._10N.222.49.B7]